MTRTQIAAKSLLTGLIVYAFVALTGPLGALPSYVGPGQTVAPFAVFLCVLLLSGVGLRIAYIEEWLLPKPAPGDEVLSPAATGRLLAQALRVTMVALGLLLLPGAIPTVIGYAQTLLGLRGLITEAIVDHRAPQAFRLSAVQWVAGLWELGSTLLVAYLLLGAPHFVRWRVSRAERWVRSGTNGNEEVDNG